LRNLESFSTTRLPEFGGSYELFSIQVSGKKCIKLDFIGRLLKMPSLVWAYFKDELKLLVLAHSQENVFARLRVPA
jgi:hypothetical protein